MGIRLGCALTALLMGQTAGIKTPASGPDVRCGSYCLFVALSASELGPAKFEDLERSLGDAGRSGYSMHQLDSEARKHGAKTIAVETTLENLKARPEAFACITLIDDNHFVLLYDIDESQVYIADPPRKYTLNADTFRNVWSRKALLIGPKDFLPEEVIESRRAWASRLWFGAGAVGLLAVLGVVGYGVRKGLAKRAAVLALLTIVAAFPGLGCGSRGGVTGEATLEKRDGTKSGGTLVVEPARHQLGRIRLERVDQLQDVTTRLRNTGSDVLVIHQIVASCDCTDAKVSRTRIEPKGEATLSTTIKLGPSTEERVTRITLRSSDPQAPETVVAFAWQVRNPLYAEVATLDLPPLKPGEGAEKTVPIHLDDLPLCDRCRLRATSDAALVGLTLTPRDVPRSASHDRSAAQAGDVVSADLEIQVSPQDDDQHFRHVVTLSVECEGTTRARFVLPVAWRVAPVVQVSPSRVWLGPASAEQRRSPKVVLRSSQGRPFRLLDVQCDEPGVLRGSRHEDRADILHTLELDVVVPEGDGPWRTVLEVQTDHPEAETIRLPLSAMIAKTPGS